MRRAELERFRADHGVKRLPLMHKVALQNILNAKTPAAQRNFKKATRGFLDHCLALDMIKVDPLGIDKALYDFVNDEAIPGSGIQAQRFWSGFGALVRALTDRKSVV